MATKQAGARCPARYKWVMLVTFTAATLGAIVQPALALTGRNHANEDHYRIRRPQTGGELEKLLSSRAYYPVEEPPFRGSVRWEESHCRVALYFTFSLAAHERTVLSTYFSLSDRVGVALGSVGTFRIVLKARDGSGDMPFSSELRHYSSGDQVDYRDIGVFDRVEFNFDSYEDALRAGKLISARNNACIGVPTSTQPDPSYGELDYRITDFVADSYRH